MAATSAKDTEVGKWLVANDGGDFADEFFKQGYEDKADLSNAVIDKIVTKPGVAARLERLLAAEKPKSDGAAPPAIPALPPGSTFDLSSTDLKSPDGIAFTLPTQLSVAASTAAV